MKRPLDTGAGDARGDHEAKRHQDDATPMVQEPSSGSGVKRSNIEAIRRADAEAEEALKRVRLLDERRVAKRASAAPMDEMETMMVAAEAILIETRETVEALTVSALQQAHAMSHRAETTAESFFQAHKDMTVTTKEQARKKQLDFLESVKVYEEVCVDGLLAGTHVMSGRWVDTMKTPTVWRSKYTARGYEEPQSDEGCFAAIVCSWQGVSTNVVRDTKLLWQTTHKLSSPLKSVKENSCACNHLKGGHQNFCRTADVWCGRCAKPCSACEHLRGAGRNICQTS